MASYFGYRPKCYYKVQTIYTYLQLNSPTLQDDEFFLSARMLLRLTTDQQLSNCGEYLTDMSC